MTELDKITMLETMTGEHDRSVLLTYLAIAKESLLRHIYQCSASVGELPDKYSLKQLEIAAYLINKRGAEGETAHSENGISRTYEDADIPSSMLKEVLPVMGVF